MTQYGFILAMIAVKNVLATSVTPSALPAGATSTLEFFTLENYTNASQCRFLFVSDADSSANIISLPVVFIKNNGKYIKVSFDLSTVNSSGVASIQISGTNTSAAVVSSSWVSVQAGHLSSSLLLIP